MSGRDELEWQRQQRVAVGLADPVETNVCDLGKDVFDVGQVIVLDETEPLEQFVSRGEVAEQLKHGLGQLVADFEQVGGEPRVLEDLSDVGVPGQIVDVERLACGSAE